MFRHVAKEELRVPGKVEYLGELRDFVTRVGKKHGFSERIINAFKLSIDEAATNIIKHAYRDWEGDITLRAVAKKNSLTIVLVDQGKYFDPRKVSSPDLQRYVDIGKKGGLGIFIMRRLLDSIEYRKTEEGNELWMMKVRDEAKKRKLSLSTIPLTLKMRYWLYSLVIFTTVLVAVSYINFSNARRDILNGYIDAGRTALSSLQGYVMDRWNAIDPEVINYLKSYGSDDIEVHDGAAGGINTLADSYKDILKEVLVVDNRGVILASSDTSRSIWEEKFTVGDYEKPLQKFSDSTVLLLPDKNGGRLLNIVWPIKDAGGEKLADAYFQIDYALVRRDVYKNLRGLLGEAGLIWLIVSAGLFFLIYVVMNPFKRLQEWVKHMSEPGSADDMDIDSTTEIGAIAQAFSDMTNQLRRSQQNLVEQERLQQEMHIAKQIQQTLLPSEFPKLEGYDLGSYYAAAKEVGGDFFDFVEVDSDTIGVVVADVSGKGVPGAFVMTMIRTALRSEARGVKDAAEVLAKVNDFVVNDMKKGMFVTLLYVIIDSKKRRLNFASAGHNPMILHRPSRNKTYYLNPRGFPIGISLPDKNLFRESIQSDTIALAEDDIVLVYTDGVTEAMNPKRRLFGEERFLKLIRESGKRSAEEFVDILKKEMNIFTEGSEQNDDITLVAVKERTSAEKIEYARAARAYTQVHNGVSIRDACKEAGISTYSYYHKFKEKFDKDGIEGYVAPIGETDQIEAKHLSIEEKNKIYDVVRRHPEYGAKRIHEELNTERYELAVIPVSKIYDELVRMRLNTKELREAFVQRGGRKKRIKPPGTPMMTIDGKIIMNRAQFEEPEADEEEPPVEPASIKKEMDGDAHVEKDQKNRALEEPSSDSEEKSLPNVFALDKEALLTAPIEDILDKRISAPKNQTNEEESPDDAGAEKSKEAPADQAERENDEHALGEEFEQQSEEAAPVDDMEQEEKIEFDEMEEFQDIDDDDDLEIFGFVEDAALTDGPEDALDDNAKTWNEKPDESRIVDKDTELPGNFTIVSEEKIKEYARDEFDAEDELAKIEENLDDENNSEIGNDLELLSGMVDAAADDEDFGFSFDYINESTEDDPAPDEDEELKETSSETAHLNISTNLENNSEEDDAPVPAGELDNDPVQEAEQSPVAEDEPEEAGGLFAIDDNTLSSDEQQPDLDAFEEEFKELLPSTDNPFDYWISEETNDQNNGNGGIEAKDAIKPESDFIENDEELDDPFEEFLEIQDEHGMITPEGDLDYEIVEQLLQANDDSENHNGNGSFEKNLVNDAPKSADEVEEREEDEKHISLDELVTVTNDEEPLFAQQDEEFDTLLKDAVSNDEKIQQLLNENAKSQDTIRGIKNNLESVLQRAAELYQESRYDDAVRILRDASERYPSDYRAHSMLGNAYFREKRYKDAAIEYERVIDLDPLNEKACENLAIAYANLGQLVKAIHQWERLLRITPNRADIHKSIKKAKEFLNKS